MTKAEPTLTPTMVRNELVGMILDDNWNRGRGFLCTEEPAPWGFGNKVIRSCPLGLLMQLAEDFGVIAPGQWSDHAIRRKGWRDYETDTFEYRRLTPLVATWAGIGTNPGFVLSKKFRAQYDLEMWPENHRFALAWLNDYTDITPPEIVDLISTIR